MELLKNESIPYVEGSRTKEITVGEKKGRYLKVAFF